MAETMSRRLFPFSDPEMDKAVWEHVLKIPEQDRWENAKHLIHQARECLGAGQTDTANAAISASIALRRLIALSSANEPD